MSESDRPKDATGRELLQAASQGRDIGEIVDAATRAQLARWFELPSFEQLGEVPEPTADEREFAEAQKIREAALAAADPAFVARVGRWEQRAAQVEFPPLPTTAGESLAKRTTVPERFVVESAIGEVHDRELPWELRELLNQCTPQALLRDLYRAETHFPKEFFIDEVKPSAFTSHEQVSSWFLVPGAFDYQPAQARIADSLALAKQKHARPWGSLSKRWLMTTPRSIPVERFLLRGVGRTDVGAQRTQNEDAMYYDDFLGFYVICDGMGGHASGQVASDVAVRTIVHAMKTGEPAYPEFDPMVTAMKAANSAVYQRALMDQTCHGMGTTAVGLRFEGDVVHICHCGDSRGYLLRGQQLFPITRDHSLRNLYEDRPDLVGTMGQATSNVIIRAVGLGADVEIEHNTLQPDHGDVFLLCCDGLNDLVEDWMIREIMTSGESLEVIADNLIRAANTNGGTDNITVVLVQTLLDPIWLGTS